MKEYNHLKIESKWQTIWDKNGIYYAKDFPRQSASSLSKSAIKPKFYGLIEFPYPSGDGLHVGHPRPYIGMDIISRKRRLEGFNVLYPIGWDAFGLPTENFAIKTGKDPRIVTKKNSDTFRRQIKSLGISFDWSREINTTDPKYYKWTQWIFLQFLKKGLAYKAKMTINWCPKDKIGLANEEVVTRSTGSGQAGVCERCGTAVEKREKEQWMLAITKYADRLYKDLDDVNYLPQIKLGQRNWIGKSEGAEIEFKVSARQDLAIKVFTTRVDTIFSCTFIVLAPEHSFIQEYKNSILNWNEVEKYIKEVKNRPEVERTAESNKTGIELKGVRVINPATKEEIPVWVSDFVLVHYGTGAVFADAHDKRDFDMAKKYNIPLKVSIKSKDESLFEKIKNMEECYEGEGVLFNSKQFDGLTSAEARPKIIDWLSSESAASRKTTFKLRDWIFSRQRYWGEPIPVIHCQDCGVVPVPEKDLPVELPKVKNYQPTDSGESPLANISKWVNVKCPKCLGKAKRETDTMPNWAGSSWYYLRYADAKNNKEFASKKNLKYWLTSPQPSPERRGGNTGGVDWYNGGNEHTTLHLLYSRFWHKFLFDLKLVPTNEPYMKRTSHGMILGEGGVKMSKSLGNVINPDDIVKTYGADTLRVYEMFMGPFDQSVAWSTESIIGARRFIEKVWRIGEKVLKFNNSSGMSKNSPLVRLLHKTIKKVSEDIEGMNFNTAISSMMILATEMEKAENVSVEDYKKFLQVLSPFAPHMTEELWSLLGEKDSINLSNWPKWDENLIKDEEIKIVIQINGKVRAEIFVQADETEESIKKKALENETVVRHIAGKDVKKMIYVKNRLVNIVI
ncbi:leucine--tRNA ligase [Candidatus Nomurabacteria bacterium RIFCSPHIGHO2_01_FULL_42_15]|uniref:Leucine--tRNA ligase n=1 Tax=Candidatus Nomurabacteria bacterium RIFCSPHIGHO2_01_FULL_42_15 TaxID=1801742 RepID=A0A1F6VFR4_9BACT|nr:MAG: leucine--tRNA ligase [Candidatus Nomurabacteria bacterium RIFCSPHIGHO2_01_FULL_42_15]OGI93170.1 MAG: leucine--tRNA ligase [Candidatus Nomurabacteria bacterium RIFCSPLOWO2_01_FULL_41_18]